MRIFSKLHQRLGDLWWYTLLLFTAQRIGDGINFFVGLWLVPRYVSPDELGAVLPLTNFGGVIGLPLSVVAIPFLKFVAVFAERGEMGKVKAIIRDAFIATSIFALGSILIAWLVLPQFFAGLRIENGSLALLIVTITVLGAIASIFTNAVSALRLYAKTVWFSALVAPVRLLAMVVFMPFRALSGYMVGQGAGPSVQIFGSLIVLRKFLFSPLRAERYFREWRGAIWRYTWPLAVMAVFTTFASNIDIFVIRHALSDFESAGYYIITRFSEISLYCGSAFSALILPMLAGRDGDDAEARHLTLHSVVGSSLAAFAVVVALALFGSRLLTLRGEWAVYASLAPEMALLALNGMLTMAASCITMAFIARSRFAFLWYTLPLTLAKSVFIALGAHTLMEIVVAMLVANALMTAGLLWQAFRPRKMV